jgi:hypothetical protein
MRVLEPISANTAYFEGKTQPWDSVAAVRANTRRTADFVQTTDRPRGSIGSTGIAGNPESALFEKN